jgi:hypothetical protein
MNGIPARDGVSCVANPPDRERDDQTDAEIQHTAPAAAKTRDGEQEDERERENESRILEAGQETDREPSEDRVPRIPVPGAEREVRGHREERRLLHVEHDLDALTQRDRRRGEEEAGQKSRSPIRAKASRDARHGQSSRRREMEAGRRRSIGRCRSKRDSTRGASAPRAGSRYSPRRRTQGRPSRDPRARASRRERRGDT